MVNLLIGVSARFFKSETTELPDVLNSGMGLTSFGDLSDSSISDDYFEWDVSSGEYKIKKDFIGFWFSGLELKSEVFSTGCVDVEDCLDGYESCLVRFANQVKTEQDQNPVRFVLAAEMSLDLEDDLVNIDLVGRLDSSKINDVIKYDN